MRDLRASDLIKRYAVSDAIILPIALQKGLVCVWTVDARGSLTPTRQYRRKGEITSAVFCMMPNSSPAATQQPSAMSIQSLLTGQRKSDSKQTNSPAFFFGTDRGAVVYADDLGHCTDVQQLTASIDTMLFYEERSRLVIITRSLLLTQYQVAEDGRVSRVMQVKMSVAGDVAEKGLKCVVWASPGLLAAATHEKMVRLLDLAADESYNLSLSAVGDILDRSDHVVCLAFGPLDRYLAVGTHCGIVAVWKFNGPIRDVSGSRAAVTPTTASHWEVATLHCAYLTLPTT
jgi:intraflagellar transport protein 140